MEGIATLEAAADVAEENDGSRGQVKVKSSGEHIRGSANMLRNAWAFKTARHEHCYKPAKYIGLKYKRKLLWCNHKRPRMRSFIYEYILAGAD